MYAETALPGHEDIATESTVVESPLPCVGCALGSGSGESQAMEPMPDALGMSEAEHLLVYLRRLDAVVGTMCARLGVSREAMRAGAPPAPASEISPEERNTVANLSRGLVVIDELVGPENDDVARPYAESQVLLALSIVGRDIDVEELHGWLTPAAQEALRLEDCREALERLAERQEIGSRAVLLAGGITVTRYGARTFRYRSGLLHRVYRPHAKV